MRCLHCRQDGLPASAVTCPRCGVYLPALLRDVLPSGTLLHNQTYRVDFALGRGGFGITYRAMHILLEQPVAIKEFYPQEYALRDANGELSVPGPRKEPYKRGLQRFIKEGRTLVRLDHRNVVRVQNLFEERGTAYLVMELIKGRMLRDELEAQPHNCFSQERVQEIAQQLVGALETVHKSDIYHLDLSPENTLVESSGRVILVDFGASRQGFSSKSTQPYRMEYAAPEVISQGDVGPESDIYELGVMICEMLTGQLPPSAMNRLMNDTWKPEGFEEPWKSLLASALRLHKEDRPKSVKEWWESAFQQVSPQINIQPPVPKPAQEYVPAQQLPKPTPVPVHLPAPQPVPQHITKPEPPLQPSQEVIERPIKNQDRKRYATIAAGLVLTVVILVVVYFNFNRPVPVGPTTPTVVEQSIKTETFNFETVKVNTDGSIKERLPKQAKNFTEDLGDGVTMDMVEIPEGSFLMGSPDSEIAQIIKEYERNSYNNSDSTKYAGWETPQHQIKIEPFFIGKYEVTQAQWRAVAKLLPKVDRDLNSDPSNNKGDNLPVEQVSWKDAVEFCKRLSKKTGKVYRLPSEAQWEYACRAGTTTPFAFGETISPEIVNYNGEYPYGSGKEGEYRAKTTPVGSLGAANGFGLYDMHGNVWEWCQDVWHDSYKGAPTDGSTWETGGDDKYRVLRGGSWPYHAILCRSSARHRDGPGFKVGNDGFRVVILSARTQ